MNKKIISMILAINCFLFASCTSLGGNGSSSESSLNESSSIDSSSTEDSSSEPAISETLWAHWKFQNVEGCYTGDIDTDELRFIDLSGNGNDLVTNYEGNGDQLDIFSWDTGVNEEELTALKFNNTLALAESVDPYDKEFTTYSGAYVSGKYLSTVGDATLSYIDIRPSWTIEIVFKVSSEWNNSYNRYTGIFSRQGVSKYEDEPFFSMATAAASNDIPGALGTANTVDLQLVYANQNESFKNSEYAVGIKAEEWVHYMVVGDGGLVSTYINGNLVETISSDCTFAYSPYGWEVGVGRKDGNGAVTMNPKHSEGLIRRLFCGSISEIKFSKEAIDVNDSLWTKIKK